MISDHYRRVRQFMELAGQKTRVAPLLPTEDERRLRARLLLEEAFEQVAALGFCAWTGGRPDGVRIDPDALDLAPTAEGPNLVEIADGCADVSVVNTGTMIACGFPDLALMRLVDENNLAKFGPGGFRDAGGKWRKPPGHRPPDIGGFLAATAACPGQF